MPSDYCDGNRSNRSGPERRGGRPRRSTTWLECTGCERESLLVVLPELATRRGWIVLACVICGSMDDYPLERIDNVNVA